MIYYVKTEGQPDTFSVCNNRPEGAVAPKTEGTMRYIPGTGFEITMRCWETDPKAVKTEPDSAVCLDSCLEVFIDFFPELPQYGYLNVEMNSIGTVLCCIGTERKGRKRLLQMGIPQPEVKVEKTDSYWQVNCLITESLLEKVYERPCNFEPGYEMRGNFYKCGDATAAPHWATWSPVERLDFHTPEFFGTLKIV